MFNFLKKSNKLVRHKYKNITLGIPSSWRCELESDDIESCFNPNSQSTLRLHIIKVLCPKDKTTEENISLLTSQQPYFFTQKGYLVTGPSYSATIENSIPIVLITWKLIDYISEEKIIGVLSYTVLDAEKDSSEELAVIDLIESSLQEAEIE